MNVRSTLCTAVALVAILTTTHVLTAQSLTRSWNNPPSESIPGVEHQTFYSASLSARVGYNILLPPDYESTSRPFPVIYSLHGAGGNENSNASIIASQIIEAFEAGDIPPLILVFVNGPRWTYYADSPDWSVPSETVFITELIPHIDSTYRTMAEPRGRAIEGYSMGGAGALTHALKHPDLFGSVVAYAPALLEVQQGADGRLTLARAGGTHEGAPPPSPRLLAASRQAFDQMFNGRREVFARHDPFVLLPEQAEHLRSDLPVRIVIGTADGLWNGNQLFHQLMLDHDYDHDFVVVPDAGHNLTTLFDAVGLEGISFHVRSNGWQ
jgi:S-formylglutathione hydrolase FrmB